ncbi:iron chelate uptake ABC transporter family permease subunit [Roseibium sp.]|uniref:iron chelate uptake ABC transporter family permease subunit n=1 Tax=Roseibium sp. TaxID=1936156 RepID=UPI00262274F0|nr:iron chelate uptake ABC transporter family permease subunit [Roseibium sp.]
MVLGARGNWDFILAFRGKKLIALIIVATAIAVATVVFQTLTSNRILTPSIMGFDALYVLLQTALVFVFGGLGYVTLQPEMKFGLEFVLLSAAALFLFGSLLGQGMQDLFRMLLVGVVFGILFRSLTNLLYRIIDPNEYAVIEGSIFASFNRVDIGLLAYAAPIILICCAIVWRKRHIFDVMALGRDQAISLGLNHRRELLIGLTLVTTLVATSTALVGPVAFFGLLVSAISYEIMKTHHHGPVFLAAALIAITVLIGGQAMFERVLGMGATLSVVIEFLGGFVFLFLILRKVRA